jgi:hypothetical protein
MFAKVEESTLPPFENLYYTIKLVLSKGTRNDEAKVAHKYKSALSKTTSSKNKMKIFLLASLGLVPVGAMTSSPHPFYESQPNGERVMLKIQGDPYDSYMSDTEGTNAWRTGNSVMCQTTLSHLTVSSHRLYGSPK